jgi:hypothetical protein
MNLSAGERKGRGCAKRDDNADNHDEDDDGDNEDEDMMTMVIPITMRMTAITPCSRQQCLE